MSVSENSLCLALPWAGAAGAVGGIEKALRCTEATPGSRYFRADMPEKTPVIFADHLKRTPQFWAHGSSM